MPPKLTVQNAEIQTASVEIKTLTVSGKQVTLAVFRQLHRGSVFGEDGDLRGELWGTVNYHPEAKECAGAEHWHVVWQSGSELRRALVAADPSWYLRPRHIPEGSRWLNSVVLDHVTTGTSYFDDGAALPVVSRYNSASHIRGEAEVHGLGITVDASDTAVAAYNAVMDLRKWEARQEDWPSPRESFWGDDDGIPHERKRAVKAVAALREEVTAYGFSTDHLFEKFQLAVRSEVDRLDRLRQSHAAIAALPQLFIAV
ncbi:hypothetical protein AB0B63_07310 [Micromonospora sp. NPDC049081]|uniref:hypothetical protein n=1 Tax=Micromonospora sp. NPDC049081 TaxID=3155150 RepID=UPI0033DD067B